MIPEHKFEIYLISGQILFVDDFEHIATQWGNAIAIESFDGTPEFINDYDISVIMEVQNEQP